MKKIYYIIILIILSSCSVNKVNKNHGNVNLNVKMEKLYISETNKNDVIKILGSPSTKSQFNENKWFFIERKVTNSSMIKLGKDKLEANNILILEFDNNGILASKKIYDKKQMQDLKFSENIVTYDYENKSLFFNIMSSVRQKIQAPIKKRIKKDRENN